MQGGAGWNRVDTAELLWHISGRSRGLARLHMQRLQGLGIWLLWRQGLGKLLLWRRTTAGESWGLLGE